MSWFSGSTTHGYIDPNTGQKVIAPDSAPRPTLTTKPTDTPAPPPTPTAQLASTTTSATAAAVRQRKRAAAGSLEPTPPAVGPNKPPPSASGKATLLGG